MDYVFPILVALWAIVVAILIRQWDAHWERFVKEMEASGVQRSPAAAKKRTKESR